MAGADHSATTKVCTKCGEEKPASEFHSQTRRGKTSLRSYCKDCHRARYGPGSGYEKPRDRQAKLEAAERRQKRAEARAILRSTIKEKTCTKCGETKPISGFRLSYRNCGDGYRSECRDCNAVIVKRWYSQKPPEYKIAAKNRALASHKRKRRERRAAGKKARPWIERWRNYVSRSAKAGREYWPRGAVMPGYTYMPGAWPFIRTKPERKQRPAMLRPWNDPTLTSAEKWKLRYSLDPDFRAKEYQKALRRKQARRRLIADSSTSPWRVELLRINAPFCAYCGRHIADVQDRHIDHVVPLAKGGAHEWENLAVTCQPCNQQKAAKMPTRAQALRAQRQRDALASPQLVLVA